MGALTGPSERRTGRETTIRHWLRITITDALHGRSLGRSVTHGSQSQSPGNWEASAVRVSRVCGVLERRFCAYGAIRSASATDARSCLLSRATEAPVGAGSGTGARSVPPRDPARGPGLAGVLPRPHPSPGRRSHPSAARASGRDGSAGGGRKRQANARAARRRRWGNGKSMIPRRFDAVRRGGPSFFALFLSLSLHLSLPTFHLVSPELSSRPRVCSVRLVRAQEIAL